MDTQSSKAFDFAADLTKQLITLSTSIVTLTFLFSKDLMEPRWLPVVIWILFLLSTMFGLWTLMGLTGTLAPVPQARPLASPETPGSPPPAGGENAGAGGEDDRPLPMGGNVRFPSMLQIVTFGIAILFTMAYVAVVFTRPVPPQTPAPACACGCPCSPQQNKTP